MLYLSVIMSFIQTFMEFSPSHVLFALSRPGSNNMSTLVWGPQQIGRNNTGGWIYNCGSGLFSDIICFYVALSYLDSIKFQKKFGAFHMDWRIPMHANGLLTIFQEWLHIYYSWKIIRKPFACMLFCNSCGQVVKSTFKKKKDHST